MRKPIQFQTIAVNPPPIDQRATSAEIRLFVLCNDGTLWTRQLHHAQAQWQRLPDIEQEPLLSTHITPPPAQAGKRWEALDDQLLLSLWHDEHLDCTEIARRLQRTFGAIVSRLVHLKDFANSDELRAANRRRQLAESG